MAVEKQRTWGWLALGNFVLGGAGAGAYAIASLAGLLQAGTQKGPIVFETAASAALVVVGLGFVFLEAGKKSRSLNVMRNLRTSWMSREAGAASLFVLFALASVASPGQYLVVIALVSAIGLLASHGFILMAAKAIPTWSTAAAGPLMWASSVAAGAGVAGLASLGSGTGAAYYSWATALSSAALLVVSLAYLGAAMKNVRLKEALGEEGNETAFWISALVGGLVPLVLSVVPASAATAVAASSLLIAGSLGMKYVLVLRLAYRVPAMAFGQPGYIFPASR